MDIRFGFDCLMRDEAWFLFGVFAAFVLLVFMLIFHTP
jgi:hypothetical protein